MWIFPVIAAIVSVAGLTWSIKAGSAQAKAQKAAIAAQGPPNPYSQTEAALAQIQSFDSVAKAADIDSQTSETTKIVNQQETAKTWVWYLVAGIVAIFGWHMFKKYILKSL